MPRAGSSRSMRAIKNDVFAKFALRTPHRHITCSFFSSGVQPLTLKGKSWSSKKLFRFPELEKVFGKTREKFFPIRMIGIVHLPVEMNLSGAFKTAS